MNATVHSFGDAAVLAATGDGAERTPLCILGVAGALIWHNLRAAGPAFAADRLASAFGLDPAAAAAEVAAAARTWARAGLLGSASATPRHGPSVPAALPPVARRRVYALCGVPIAVRFAARAVEALVVPRFAWSERPGLAPVTSLTLARDRRGYLLREAGEPDIRAADAVTMSGLFTRRFAELSHGTRDWLAVLHAAAVGDARGAIVLPGPNGTGKSTLTAALLAGGARYFSDDCVPIDGSGLIRPVPFALSHKDRCAGRLRLAYQQPPGPAPLPAPPRLFLFPRFSDGCRPEARRLTPPEALGGLVAGRAWLSRRPEGLRRTLAMIEAVPAWELAYPSTAEALALVADCERMAAAA